MTVKELQDDLQEYINHGYSEEAEVFIVVSETSYRVVEAKPRGDFYFLEPEMPNGEVALDNYIEDTMHLLGILAKKVGCTRNRYSATIRQDYFMVRPEYSAFFMWGNDSIQFDDFSPEGVAEKITNFTKNISKKEDILLQAKIDFHKAIIAGCMAEVEHHKELLLGIEPVLPRSRQ